MVPPINSIYAGTTLKLTSNIGKIEIGSLCMLVRSGCDHRSSRIFIEASKLIMILLQFHAFQKTYLPYLIRCFPFMASILLCSP